MQQPVSIYTAIAYAFRCSMVAVMVITSGSSLFAMPSEPSDPGIRTNIFGRVVDAAGGPDAGIAGAQVELGVSGPRPNGSATTLPDGSFAITLDLLDDDSIFLDVHADGFRSHAHWYSGPELRQASPLLINLTAVPPRVDTRVTGLVFDASIGRNAPIADAEVAYVYHSQFEAFPEVSDVVHTGADGRYGFDQPLGPSGEYSDDYIEIDVAAPGFAPFDGNLGADDLIAGTPADIALAPLGGIVQIEPARVDIACPDSFPVTITNVGAADEALVILGIERDFHYGGGVYGTAFGVHMGEIEFPVSLARGEQLDLLLTFRSGDRFPTFLTLIVEGGQREGGVATFFGGFQPCSRCSGDCDASDHVTIDELQRAVNIAVQSRATSDCAAADTDHDGTVSISELVAAVAHALRGCDDGE